MTPVAVLGLQAGVLIARILTVAFVVAVVVLSLVFRVWPPGAAVAALVALPILFTQSKSLSEPGLDTSVRMLGAALGACVLGDAALTLSSLVRVWMR